jgi:hypothetical protein
MEGQGRQIEGETTQWHKCIVYWNKIIQRVISGNNCGLKFWHDTCPENVIVSKVQDHIAYDISLLWCNLFPPIPIFVDWQK